MRLYAAWAAFIFMWVYAFHNWYRAALFLVLTMAVVERQDFPRSVLGITGLEPWNILMACAVVSYVFHRSEPRAPMGKGIAFLVFFYLLAVIIASTRGITDLTGIWEFSEYLKSEPVTVRGVFIDDFVNTLKYVVPGVLVYLGCNSYERVKEAVWAIVLMNILLALLVIKSMGFDALSSGSELEQTAIRRLDRDTGYFRSDLAIFLAGASWAVFAFSRFIEHPLLRYGLMAGSVIVAVAIGLTGGRMGMGAWAVLGLVFGILRWRQILIVAPVVALVLFATVPAVQERLLQGFGGESDGRHGAEAAPAPDGDVDLSSVTSGRVIIWPHVIETIGEGPLIGYGRRAMQRIGLSMEMAVEYDKPFAHPHNAYLQLLLDNGLLFGGPILLFYILILKYSITMTRDTSRTLYPLVGSISLAFVLSFLVGGVAQQSFYPTISSVSMWVSIGLLLRVRAEHAWMAKAEEKEKRVPFGAAAARKPLTQQPQPAAAPARFSSRTAAPRYQSWLAAETA